MFLYGKYSFLLLTRLFSCACVSDSLIPMTMTTPTKENLVAKIVSDFTLKFIQSHTKYISVMSMSSTPEHNRIHQDIIGNLIMLNNPKFTYRITDDQMYFSRRHTFRLFVIESYKDFV